MIYIGCENANIGYGDIIAKGVRILLVVITFGIVFEYLGVGSTIISISFLIIFGGIIMTLSLALGIGLSTVITDFIKERFLGAGTRTNRQTYARRNRPNQSRARPIARVLWPGSDKTWSPPLMISSFFGYFRPL